MLQLSKLLVGTSTMKIAGFIATSALSSYYLFRKVNSYTFVQEQKSKRLAGCLNENGEGAQKLRNQFPEQIFVSALNVTDMRSLENFHCLCRQILETHEGKLRLWAIIANAAVCMLGEYFWQTQLQREQQMNVNYWGTVNFISEFRTPLFENKARLVVISSDCSEYPLPYLAAYSASKAAINAWTQSLRFEVAKYGVQVISYHPRDFAKKSSMFANMESQYKQMAEEMSDIDKSFYGEYFERFMKNKVETFECTKKPVEVMDSAHHRNAFYFLLENDIANISVYRDSSFAQFVIHGLYKKLPQRYVDKMVNFLLNPHMKTIYWRGPKSRASQTNVMRCNI